MLKKSHFLCIYRYLNKCYFFEALGSIYTKSKIFLKQAFIFKLKPQFWVLQDQTEKILKSEIVESVVMIYLSAF